jgi:hypothetical protein
MRITAAGGAGMADFVAAMVDGDGVDTHFLLALRHLSITHRHLCDISSLSVTHRHHLWCTCLPSRCAPCGASRLSLLLLLLSSLATTGLMIGSASSGF